jgi:hypothetical protein
MFMMLVVFSSWGQAAKPGQTKSTPQPRGAVQTKKPSQDKKPEKADADTVRVDYRPTGIRIGTDAIAIARNFYDKTYNGWEVNADADFSRYYLAVDVGSWSRKFLSDSSSYSNKGNYWRVGVDVNFLLKDPDRNMLFFGLRYGHSNFSESMSVLDADKIWGNFSNTYNNADVKAHWLELNTGLRVKIWRMIWVGYTARFKFGLKTKGYTDMIPSDVPGYGATDKDNTWGFNYQIFFRIPVRKQPLFVAPSK